MIFDVHRCPADLVKATVERDHYLKRWPDVRSMPFAYCLSVDGARLAGDGRPFGVTVMKRLQHSRQRQLNGYEGLPTCWQVLDLARVWVHPELQNLRWDGADRKGEVVTHTANVFSRMVSGVIRRVQMDWLEHHPPRFPELPYHIELVISYCDLGHHDGTGYRASNFQKWGLTSDGTKEIYYRRLKAPRFKYVPMPEPQRSLFEAAA